MVPRCRSRNRTRSTHRLGGIPIEHREPGPVDVGRVDSARRRHRVRLRHSKGRHAHRQASGQRFRDSRPNSGLRRMGLSPQPSDNRAALDSRNRSCGNQATRRRHRSHPELRPARNVKREHATAPTRPRNPPRWAVRPSAASRAGRNLEHYSRRLLHSVRASRRL